MMWEIWGIWVMFGKSLSQTKHSFHKKKNTGFKAGLLKTNCGN